MFGHRRPTRHTRDGSKPNSPQITRPTAERSSRKSTPTPQRHRHYITTTPQVHPSTSQLHNPSHCSYTSHLHQGTPPPRSALGQRITVKHATTARSHHEREHWTTEHRSVLLCMRKRSSACAQPHHKLPLTILPSFTRRSDAPPPPDTPTEPTGATRQCKGRIRPLPCPPLITRRRERVSLRGRKMPCTAE